MTVRLKVEQHKHTCMYVVYTFSSMLSAELNYLHVQLIDKISFYSLSIYGW